MAENGKFTGREVVIVEAARLPVGRGHEEKGYYKDVPSSSLLAKTYDETIKRAAERIRATQFKVAAYAEYLADEKGKLDRELAAARDELRAKVEQLATAAVA